jgi:hypothetical protein
LIVINFRTGGEKLMWEGEEVVISRKRNNGREREQLMFIKLIQ